MGHKTVQYPPLSGPSLLMRPSAGEFNLEVQHTSKVKIKQLFTVFLRHPETGKLLGITLIPPVNGLGWRGYCQGDHQLYGFASVYSLFSPVSLYTTRSILSRMDIA